MLLHQLLAFVLSITLAPCLTSAAIFPKDTLVKSIDTKGFRKAMKENQTSVVAFVAPWCGHCQRMAPEFSKAAKGLHPLIPMYAVDCDAQENKALCAEQGVQGFPTVKLFPRGNQAPPILHNGERTAHGFYYWASWNVPHSIKKLKTVGDISKWVKQSDKPHALLLHKKGTIPLLWQVLANMFKHRIGFGFNHDSSGMSSSELGLEKGGDAENKILIYPGGSDEPVMYEGKMKSEALSKFFRSVIKGTINLQPKRKNEEESRGDKQKVSGTSQGKSADKSTSEKSAPNVRDERVPTAAVDVQEPQSTNSNLKVATETGSREFSDDSVVHSSEHIADEL